MWHTEWLIYDTVLSLDVLTQRWKGSEFWQTCRTTDGSDSNRGKLL